MDCATIPRGGHNRRKSMEPKVLAHLNGSLVSAPAAATPRRAASYEYSPTKSLLGSTSPDDEVSLVGGAEMLRMPATPGAATSGALSMGVVTPGGVSQWGSPTTPYFLNKGAELLQKTCPPKQTGQGLFPVSGNIEEVEDGEMRRKLIAARRKSLQWVPKVSSPLSRT